MCIFTHNVRFIKHNKSNLYTCSTENERKSAILNPNFAKVSRKTEAMDTSNWKQIVREAYDRQIWRALNHRLLKMKSSFPQYEHIYRELSKIYGKCLEFSNFLEKKFSPNNIIRWLILVKISFPKNFKIPNICRRSWTIPDICAHVEGKSFSFILPTIANKKFRPRHRFQVSQYSSSLKSFNTQYFRNTQIVEFWWGIWYLSFEE